MVREGTRREARGASPSICAVFFFLSDRSIGIPACLGASGFLQKGLGWLVDSTSVRAWHGASVVSIQMLSSLRAGFALDCLPF